MKMNNDSEHQTKNATLNTKMKMWLWMPKWSEQQLLTPNEKNVTLDIELKV